MLKVVFAVFLAGCVIGDNTTPDAGNPAPIEPQMTIDGVIDPAALLPACKRLETTDPCCQLACTDAAAFDAQCAQAGACAEWVCPLQGGGSVRFESCKP